MPLNMATRCSFPHSIAPRTRCRGSIGVTNSFASKRRRRLTRCSSSRSTCLAKHPSGTRSSSGTAASHRGMNLSSSSTNALGCHSAATLSVSSSSSSTRARLQITRVSFCLCWQGVNISQRNTRLASSWQACTTCYTLMSSSNTLPIWKTSWCSHRSMSSAWP
jgi:hypothetical protein